jgi:non-specific serine/threonine protein kinase
MPTSLPQQVTTFVGRERELAELHRLLDGHRMVTLLGPGGTGKTRLALEIASKRSATYPDGVAFIDLSSLSDPSLVPQAFASALGVQEESGRSLTETLIQTLQTGRRLLIVDNIEHLLEQTGSLCRAILKGSAEVQILATSRASLGDAEERVFQVPSLSIPDSKVSYTPKKLEEFEAVRLFIDRASRGRPNFQVSRVNSPLVARLCMQLDGIPLAIELAAALVGVMPVDNLSARISDRFDTLTDGGMSSLPRTQTLRAMIAWSYEQLSDEEQKVLRRLSVFTNGCRLESAIAICADDEGGSVRPEDLRQILQSLVSRALLICDEAQDRYRLLETVRGYTRDALDETIEADAVRDRHLEHFYDLCKRTEGELNGPEARASLARLDEEHENLRTALEWGAKDGDRHQALELAVSLSTYYQVRGMFEEGCASYAALLAVLDGEPDAVVAKAYASQGVLLFRQGQFGLTRQRVGRALEIFEALGDKHGTAQALNTLAVVALQLKEYETAAPLFERALALFREVGEDRRIAMTLNNLGILAVHLGDIQRAKSLYAEALEVNRQSGNQRFEAGNLTNLADLALRESEGPRARDLARKACAIHLDLGDRQNLQDTFEVLVAAELMCGRPYVAAVLLANKEALMAELGTAVAPFVADEYRKNVEAVQRALGDETFRAAFTEGRSMSAEDAFRASLEDF